jgi:hypothetical protein
MHPTFKLSPTNIAAGSGRALQKVVGKKRLRGLRFLGTGDNPKSNAWRRAGGEQRCNAKQREDRGSHRVYQVHRDLRCQLFADKNGWHVCKQHAQDRTDDHEHRGTRLSDHRHCGELGFVAHLCEEEGNQRGNLPVAWQYLDRQQDKRNRPTRSSSRSYSPT